MRAMDAKTQLNVELGVTTHHQCDCNYFNLTLSEFDYGESHRLDSHSAG